MPLPYSSPTRSTVVMYAHPSADWTRPPDWRFELSKIGKSASGDTWGERLLAYRQHPTPSMSDEPLAGAHGLLDGDPLRLAEIEARILADEPIEAISRKCHIAVSTIEAYEAVYFDVRRRLRFSGWVRQDVLNRNSAVDVGELWKNLSYRVGVPILETLLAAADRNQLLELGPAAYANSDLDESVKTLIAIFGLPAPATIEDTLTFLALAELKNKIIADLRASLRTE